MKDVLRFWVFIAVMMAPVLASASSHSISVTAYLDRETIYLDESVNLIVTVEGIATEVSGNPDLSELEDEFEIVSESTQTNIQIQNGVSNVVHNWIYGIRPNRAGTIIVPGISVGRYKTDPMQIEVKEFTGNVQKAGEDLFVEIEVTPQNPYVQSQVIFIARLFTAVDIAQGSLSDPVVSFAEVQQLGNDRRYDSKRGGRNYDVIEKRYAVFPEQSGTHEISPVEFKGVVSIYNQSTLQTQFRRERVSSEPVILQVRPKPPSYSGKTWLPASDLQMSDSWNGRLPDLEMGRPETRNISVEAIGLRAIQLSSPEYEADRSVRIYSNSPTLDTHQTSWATIAQRKEEFVFIPNDKENVTIPEFRVIWWDVDEDKQKVAVLPRITNVQLASGTDVLVSNDPANEFLTPSSSEELASGLDERDSTWMLISIGMLIMWLLTLAGWYYSRRINVASDTDDFEHKDRHTLTIRESIRDIKSACRDNDAGRVAIALLDLARLWWPERSPRNLIDLGLRVGDREFNRELQILDLKNYSNDSQDWDGEQFWNQFARIRKIVQTPMKKRRGKFFSARSERHSDDLWFEHELSTD